MKSIIITACMVFAFSACSDSKNTKEEEIQTDVSDNSVSDAAINNPDYDAGLELVAKSDCFTCHKLRDVSTGPSYGAVAEKYSNTPENVALLADKIINGGQGVWGSTPMLAHPGVKKEDAEKMVKYILLLKK